MRDILLAVGNCVGMLATAVGVIMVGGDLLLMGSIVAFSGIGLDLMCMYLQWMYEEREYKSRWWREED